MKYLSCLEEFSPRFNITYKCQMFLYCKYCYAKEELKKFKDDMTIDDFSNMIKWFNEEYGLKNVVFIGGESTIHPELEEFSNILTKNQIGGYLFTNGCFNQKTLDIIMRSKSFHTIVFHYEPSFFSNPKLKKLFLKNLDELSKLKNIIFRYNTGSPEFDYDELINLSKRYNASIAYSFTSPSLNRKIDYVKIEGMKKFVPQLIRFLKDAEKNGVEVVDKRPLPYCIFDEEELKFIKKIEGIRTVCCKGSVCVNPDLSLIAAPTLTTIKTTPVKSKNDLIEKVNELSKKVENLKWKHPT